jgi:hypothetical protein
LFAGLYESGFGFGLSLLLLQGGWGLGIQACASGELLSRRSMVRSGPFGALAQVAY